MEFLQADAPVFRHRIRQQAITEDTHLRLSLLGISSFKTENDGLTNAQTLESFNSQTGCCLTGGFTRWIQNRGTQLHFDASLVTRQSEQAIATILAVAAAKSFFDGHGEKNAPTRAWPKPSCCY